MTGSNLLKQFVKYELYITGKLLSFSLTKCTAVKCVLSTNFRDNPCIIELNYMYMHVEDWEFNQLIHAFVLSQRSSGLDDLVTEQFHSSILQEHIKKKVFNKHILFNLLINNRLCMYSCRFGCLSKIQRYLTLILDMKVIPHF